MSAHEEEEQRIRGAYQRRSDAVPGDRYALDRPGSIQIRALQLENVARALSAEGLLPLGERSILEVGCGFGQWLVDFESMGADRANLAGVDLLEQRIEVARRRLCERRDDRGVVLDRGADLRAGSAAELPWESNRFDLVFQSTVFTSILDSELRAAIAAEMKRVVKRDGLILWYDFAFDNPRNRDVRGVGRRELSRLFSGCSISLKRVTLAPPLGRTIAPRARELASLLERMGLFNTHLLARIRLA